MISRKIFLFVVALIIFCCQKNFAQAAETFAELENKFAAIVGVYALDMNSGAEISYNADKRFAYCSAHKVFSVAELLRQKNLSDLDEIKFFTAKDILDYAPVTKNHVDSGMTLTEICEASIRLSDNTAANLILREIGGVKAFKSALKKIGDKISKPTRYEPELNIFVPGKNFDTSTPRQMAKNLQAYILGDVLSAEKKILLVDWMSGNAITDELIKAAAPEGWKVIDKSGSGNYGTRNDIAVIYPPNRKPIILAIMSRRRAENLNYDNALIAEAAKIVFDSFQKSWR